MLREPRLPGPTGLPTVGGSRTPGPLRLDILFLADAGVVAIARKRLPMPAPLPGDTSLAAHDVTWDLYKNSAPALEDVFQTSLPNCPLAALLAGLANMSKGQQFIQKLITEHKNTAVDTDVSAASSQFAEPVPGNVVASQRFFEVMLGGKTVEVSAVFYTDDADRNWSPTYMRPPTQALWACVIEKAYAVNLGSYDKLSGLTLTANTIWEGVMGQKPGGFTVTAQTDDAKIKDVANAANQTPALAASKANASDVEPSHGFAILGMDGPKLKLYNPHGKQLSLTLDIVRKNFDAILFGDPA